MEARAYWGTGMGVATGRAVGLPKRRSYAAHARLAKRLRKVLRESRALATFGFMRDTRPYICNICPQRRNHFMKTAIRE
jgi:gluconate kinase